MHHLFQLLLTEKKVWDLYDSGDFEAIKARTASEVEDAIEITNRIISRCKFYTATAGDLIERGF